MRTLFKTSEIIKFLHSWNCPSTAETISNASNGAEFLDAKLVRGFLIDKMYIAINETLNKYTYKS